jgi:hypothetical protein
MQFRKGKVLILAIVVIVFLFAVIGILNLLRPTGNTNTTSSSAVYAECGGMTYDLNQSPLACDTLQSGMMQCRQTVTTNGMEIITISETPENQTCS